MQYSSTATKFLLSLSALLLIPSSRFTHASEIDIKLTRSGPWFVANTTNFQICSKDPNCDLKSLILQCEDQRTQLKQKWLRDELTSTEKWSPKCQIVIHPTQAAYKSYLGPGAGSSVGCTSINVTAGRIKERRIDLRSDASDWNIDALPHELTHVVLADRFGNRPLPLWADEGMGVLAESPSKQQKRQLAATRMEHQKGTISAANLLYDSSLPRQKIDAFYGRSAELVQFLIDQKDAATFITFLDRSNSQGYDKPLRELYGIEGVQQLQSLWRDQQERTLATRLR